MTNNEKILKRALEMAVKEFAESSSCPCDNHAYCHQFPFCGHTDCVAHSVELFIRKAKEDICKGN